MKNERRLGKGLSALISEISASFPEEDASDQNSKKTLNSLPLSCIRANPNQPRQKFDENYLLELADSIQKHGVIQPIIVKYEGENDYKIIAGERRYRAAQIAGLTEIPAIVRDATDIETLELALIENIQRQELSPLEEANAYQKLIEEHLHTHESLAHALGKSRSHITNMMRLLKLPKEVMDMLSYGKISIGHARALVNSVDPIEIANTIIDKGLNVRAAEALVAKRAQEKKNTESTTNDNIVPATVEEKSDSQSRPNLKSSNAIAESNKTHDSDDSNLAQIENTLSSILGCNVSLSLDANGGYALTISCDSFTTIDGIISGLSNMKFDLF